MLGKILLVAKHDHWKWELGQCAWFPTKESTFRSLEVSTTQHHSGNYVPSQELQDVTRERSWSLPTSHFLSFFVLSAITPPSTFQISLQTWFTNSLAWEMTSGGPLLGSLCTSRKAQSLHTNNQEPWGTALINLKSLSFWHILRLPLLFFYPFTFSPTSTLRLPPQGTMMPPLYLAKPCTKASKVSISM